MKSVFFAWFLFCCTSFAQTAVPGGVLEQWEVQALLKNLEMQAKHLDPVIQQVTPEQWVQKGAPDTYISQTSHSQADLKYLIASSDALLKQPDRLTLALDTYFRMLALEKILGPVMEGARKYQSPELATQIQNILNENGANRDKLRQYVQDLASEKEQEFTVADREAQRCRGMLMSQPATTSQKKRTN